MAYAGPAKGNLSFNLELGQPEIAITNPNGSTAYYSGIGTNFKANFPAFSTPVFEMGFYASLKYFDLKNTTTAAVKETAQMIGPGAGINFKLYIVSFGYGMDFMKARHQSVAIISNNIDYSFTYTGYYVGLMKTFNRLGIGLFLTSTTGTISSKETGLSKDSDIKENTYWLSIKYDFGISTKKFIDGLTN